MGGFGLKRINGANLVNSDGTVDVICRKCGRKVSRRLDSRVTSISECLICQGYPEENVLAQYVQANPFSPPVPVNIDQPSLPIPGGNKIEDRVGLMSWVFKAIGLPRRKPAQEGVQIGESKKVAIRKKRKSVFEPEEETYE